MCDEYIDLDDLEDYEFQYEDSASEPDVDLENQYYQSKLLKGDNLHEALESFTKVIELQGDNKSIWGFKSLKQMIKINFALGHHEHMLARYGEMLTYIKSSVTKNQAEKSINSILDYTSTSNNHALLSRIYNKTLEVLRDAKNHRLWFKTNTKLGKVYLDCGEYGKVAQIVNELKSCCSATVANNCCGGSTGDADDPMDTAAMGAHDGAQSPPLGAADDPQRGNQLLEIYAIEIQIYSTLKNYKQLRDLYARALQVRSAIPHPIVMSIIRECGGKMYLRSGQYEDAYTAFFEAFKNYDEAGSSRRINCLKYLILTSMLMCSDINPIDSQEAKPYKDDNEIVGIKELLLAYQQNNANRFEEIFESYKETFVKDPFIVEHIEGLFRRVRTRVITELIKPYRNIKISFIAERLRISEADAEILIIACILDGQIEARIDQVNNVLLLIGPKTPADRRNEAILNMLDKIKKINENLSNALCY